MDTSTHKTVNLAGLFWVENGRVASFSTSRPGYGVQVVATGEVLARDGQPAAWRLRSAADTIAKYAEGMTRYTPMSTYQSAEDAHRNIDSPRRADTDRRTP